MAGNGNNRLIKWLGLGLTVVLVAGGIVFGYGQLNARVDTVQERQGRIEQKLDELMKGQAEIAAQLRAQRPRKEGG
ncbi:MAG TPA: hypothetical protein VMW52_01975 [Phycisphaerae bacterium]|nr:hypothetical protein [Phycisphaerae bacterium]